MSLAVRFRRAEDSSKGNRSAQAGAACGQFVCGFAGVMVHRLGNEYGFEDAEGISPTQREFELATRRHKHRLIFVKGADDKQKHPRMRTLIRNAGVQLIRRWSNTWRTRS